MTKGSLENHEDIGSLIIWLNPQHRTPNASVIIMPYFTARTARSFFCAPMFCDVNADKADIIAAGNRNISEINFSTTPTAEESVRLLSFAITVIAIKEIFISVSCIAIGSPIIKSF